jgi:hypothetical protein
MAWWEGYVSWMGFLRGVERMGGMIHTFSAGSPSYSYLRAPHQQDPDGMVESRLIDCR